MLPSLVGSTPMRPRHENRVIMRNKEGWSEHRSGPSVEWHSFDTQVDTLSYENARTCLRQDRMYTLSSARSKCPAFRRDHAQAPLIETNEVCRFRFFANGNLMPHRLPAARADPSDDVASSPLVSSDGQLMTN